MKADKRMEMKNTLTGKNEHEGPGIIYARSAERERFGYCRPIGEKYIADIGDFSFSKEEFLEVVDWINSVATFHGIRVRTF